MRLLLDTHIFLWALLEPERLPRGVATVLEERSNELWLSPITVWEVLMLADRGRVTLEPDATTWVRRSLAAIPFREAPLTHEVALASQSVDLPHRDPADRFLAATARVFQLTLVTLDRRLLRCPTLRVLELD
ncbi:MAG: type II toxin-antitoxin system VapC family toxin [Acidobacteriota bacterium]